jgi:hypothetical protein
LREANQKYICVISVSAASQELQSAGNATLNETPSRRKLISAAARYFHDLPAP